MDNLFTDYALAEEFLQKKITILGTLRKNKCQIPPSFLPNRKRAPLSTLFGFHDNIKLCSFVPEVNRAVLLLSTMHKDNKCDDDGTRKSEMVLDYNATKRGVDRLDQVITNYTCKRISRRWPLALFF